MNYVSSHKKQLLDSLENQVLYADLISIIIGSKGLGKTFILDSLCTRLDGQVYITQIQATPTLTFEQLEKSISLQLGLSWQANELGLFEKIKSHLEKRTLICIDDAHLLEADCLERLLDFSSKQKGEENNFIYILMAGESVLANKLNDTPTLLSQPDVCIVFELQPIEKNEAAQLIAYFQELDVKKIDNLYDEHKVNSLWQISHGNPGDLKYQIDRWLKETGQTFIDEEKQTSRLKQYLVASGYFTLALTLLLVLIYQKEINQVITPSNNKQIPKLIDNKSNPIGKSHENKPDNQAQQVISQQDQLSQKASLNSTYHTDNQSIVKSQQEKQNLAINQPAVANDEEMRELSALKEQPNISEVEKARELSALSEDKQANASSGHTQSQQVQTALQTEALSSRKIAGFQLTDDEDQLLARAPSNYTLQWMGLSSFETAIKAKKAHPLADSLLIFRRKFKHDYLYMIVGSIYSSKTEAENAKLIYKQRGYQGDPWVKSLQAIQSEINALQK